MSRSWLRVLAFIAVVVFGPGCLVAARSTGAVVVNDGLSWNASDTIVHAENRIVANDAALEVSALFPIHVASISGFAGGINASSFAATTCRCESYMRPTPDSGGLDGGTVVLADDDSNDSDEYALPGNLSGIGSYLGAASDLAAWPEQLPESRAPAPPEYPPAA